MWDSNHQTFEESVVQTDTRLIKNDYAAMIFRFIFLCIFIGGWVVKLKVDRDGNPLGEIILMSHWGWFFSTVYCLQALWFCSGRQAEEREDKHTLCAAYKWLVLGFEFSFVTNFTISLFYWSALWPFIKQFAEGLWLVW